MIDSYLRRGELRQAEDEANRAEALRFGLVLVPLSAKRHVVVSIGPSRLDVNYDPVPGGGVAETAVGGRPCHYLRGAVVCGPAAYDDCLVYIKDRLAARGAAPRPEPVRRRRRRSPPGKGK